MTKQDTTRQRSGCRTLFIGIFVLLGLSLLACILFLAFLIAPHLSKIFGGIAAMTETAKDSYHQTSESEELRSWLDGPTKIVLPNGYVPFTGFEFRQPTSKQPFFRTLFASVPEVRREDVFEAASGWHQAFHAPVSGRPVVGVVRVLRSVSAEEKRRQDSTILGEAQTEPQYSLQIGDRTFAVEVSVKHRAGQKNFIHMTDLDHYSRMFAFALSFSAAREALHSTLQATLQARSAAEAKRSSAAEDPPSMPPPTTLADFVSPDGTTLAITRMGRAESELLSGLASPSYTQIQTVLLRDAVWLSDAALQHVIDLPALESLDLSRAAMLPESIRNVSSARRLRRLNLSKIKFDGRILNSVCAPNLLSLRLIGTSIADEHLASLQKCRNLKELFLGETALTGQGLRAISALPISHLSLSGVQISAESLKHINAMPLRSLNVINATIDDTRLSYLHDLPQLQKLYLTGTSISSKSLRYLKQFKSLKRLDLPRGLSLSWEDLEQLSDTKIKELSMQGAQFRGSPEAPSSGFTSLETLDLYGSNITAEDLQFFAKAPLKNVTLGPESRISRSKLKAFLKQR